MQESPWHLAAAAQTEEASCRGAQGAWGLLPCLSVGTPPVPEIHPSCGSPGLFVCLFIYFTFKESPVEEQPLRAVAARREHRPKVLFQVCPTAR